MIKSEQISLGDLEFKGRDFINLPLPIPGEKDSLEVIAERANKLLRERLEKAPEIRFPSLDDDWYEAEGSNPEFPYRKTGRLVCIEELPITAR